MSSTVSVFDDAARAEFSAREALLIEAAMRGETFQLFRFWHEKRLQFIQCASAK